MRFGLRCVHSPPQRQLQCGGLPVFVLQLDLLLFTCHLVRVVHTRLGLLIAVAEVLENECLGQFYADESVQHRHHVLGAGSLHSIEGGARVSPLLGPVLLEQQRIYYQVVLGYGLYVPVPEP